MGNAYFAPEKPRSSNNWPLRQCCGCIPNAAGMIILGVLSLMSFFSLMPQNDPNRDAYSENLCEDNDNAMGPLGAYIAFAIIGATLTTIFGVLSLWLGIIGCQLQNNPNATVQGGCCGRSTGIGLGKCAIIMVCISSLIGFIGQVVSAAGKGGLAKATCCMILAYDLQEKDLRCNEVKLDGLNSEVILGCKPQTSQAETNLKNCGFEEDGSDFNGIIDYKGNTDYVFATEEQDEKVEGSGTANWFLLMAIGGMVGTLICCPLCTMFVYSATYEVSEAGQSSTVGYGGNAAATSVSAV